MLYVLTFGGDPITLEILPPSETAAATAEVEAWWRHQRSSGKMLGGAQLMAPLTATTVRFDGCRSSIHDGTFTREELAIGGYGILEAADLDEALQVALSWPAGGYVEIRPLLLSSTSREVNAG